MRARCRFHWLSKPRRKVRLESESMLSMEPGVLAASELRLPGAGVLDALSRLSAGELPQSSWSSWAAADGPAPWSMAAVGLSAGRRRLERVRIAGAARIGLELPLRRRIAEGYTESLWIVMWMAHLHLQFAAQP